MTLPPNSPPWLEKQLNANATAHPNPGAPAIHRLNRLEYGNTIRDLLGLQVDVNTLLPGDDSGYGFDNIGDVLSVSPVLLEKYMGGRPQDRPVPLWARWIFPPTNPSFWFPSAPLPTCA